MSEQQGQPDLGGELAADHDQARPWRDVHDPDGLLCAIRELVRVKGGGDVQKTFGRPQARSGSFHDLGGQWFHGGGGSGGGDAESTGGAPSDPPVITASGGLRLATLGAIDG